MLLAIRSAYYVLCLCIWSPLIASMWPYVTAVTYIIWALQAAGMRICMSISFNPFRLAQIRNISIARVKFIFLS